MKIEIGKSYWVRGTIGLPVRVEVIDIDDNNVKIKTNYQEGWLGKSELSDSEFTCDQR